MQNRRDEEKAADECRRHLTDPEANPNELEELGHVLEHDSIGR